MAVLEGKIVRESIKVVERLEQKIRDEYFQRKNGLEIGEDVSRFLGRVQNLGSEICKKYATTISIALMFGEYYLMTIEPEKRELLWVKTLEFFSDLAGEYGPSEFQTYYSNLSKNYKRMSQDGYSELYGI